MEVDGEGVLVSGFCQGVLQLEKGLGKAIFLEMGDGDSVGVDG